MTWGWFDGYRPYYYSPTYYTDYVYTQSVPTPVYYNYGDNVIYDGDMVYVNGVPYVSADKFYEQSVELAQRGTTTTVIQMNPTQTGTDSPALPMLITNSPSTTTDSTQGVVPANQSSDPSEQWMPLGTFAILQGDEENGESNQIVQLAMNRGGIVRGNLYDRKTDDIVALEGAVDQETQRVAFRISPTETDGKSDTTGDAQVFECGLWNLTQDSLPVLFHQGSGKNETKKFIRLTEDVKEDAEQTTSDTYPPSSGLNLDLTPK